MNHECTRCGAAADSVAPEGLCAPCRGDDELNKRAASLANLEAARLASLQDDVRDLSSGKLRRMRSERRRFRSEAARVVRDERTNEWRRQEDLELDAMMRRTMARFPEVLEDVE